MERRPGHAARLNGPLRGRSFISLARSFISEARSFTALLQRGEHVAVVARKDLPEEPLERVGEDRDHLPRKQDHVGL